MTTIKLHGILGAEYGDSFNMAISKPRDVIRAIDASRDGFRKRVIQLQKNGLSYDILVDKRRVGKEEFLSSKTPKQIDIVPLISGQGGLDPLTASLLISLASSVIQYALMDPGVIEGGTATVSGTGGSLIFQGGAANLATQGEALPIGYGRLMVGSNIIQSCIKSVPQTIQSINAMTSVVYNKLDTNGADLRNAFINE